MKDWGNRRTSIRRAWRRRLSLRAFPRARIRSGNGLEPRLVQAADLIGQLGDPLYPKKANALFYEFEELGSNRQFGYASPADLVEKFPGFYWNTVSAHLEEGMKYLSLTASGRQWIANLHNHIFSAEHFNWLMGPQI